MPQDYPFLTPAPPPGQVAPPDDDFDLLFEQMFPSNVQDPISQFKTEQQGSSETIKQALAEMKAQSEKRPTLDKIMAALNSIAAIADLTGKSGGARRSASSKFAANREAREGRETGRKAKLRQNFLDTFATEELLGKRRQTSLDATLSGARIKTARAGTVASSLASQKARKQGGDAAAAKQKLIDDAMKIFKDYTPDEIANSSELQYRIKLSGVNMDFTSTDDKFTQIQKDAIKEMRSSPGYKAMVETLKETYFDDPDAFDQALAAYEAQKLQETMARNYPQFLPPPPSALDAFGDMVGAVKTGGEKPTLSKYLSGRKTPGASQKIKSGLNKRNPKVQEELGEALNWWIENVSPTKKLINMFNN